MKIFNIMLSRDLGGVQQAFLDYALALQSQNLEITNITSLYAKINASLDSLQRGCKLPNLGPWDPLSVFGLMLELRLHKPDVIIAHGNRAISFALKARIISLAGQKKPVIVGVAHNYSTKWLQKCDYIIVLTNHMKQYLLNLGVPDYKLQHIPNMINLSNDALLPARKNQGTQSTLVIGTFARFVKKKAIDLFLESLAILKSKGYQFKAIIGGDGEERKALMDLAVKFKLTEQVKFTGWVQDKQKFFSEIDIFCLPSKHEPFGIILLEAMASGVPIVSTKTEGPIEILTHKQDALLAEIDAADLADKIAYIIENMDKAKTYTNNAYLRLTQNYVIDVVSQKLAKFLTSITQK